MIRPHTILVFLTGRCDAEAPGPTWDMSLTGDYSVIFHLPTAPNCFHRGMQRALLGVKYRRHVPRVETPQN
jgi:hypothetical protein